MKAHNFFAALSLGLVMQLAGMSGAQTTAPATTETKPSAAFEEDLTGEKQADVLAGKQPVVAEQAAAEFSLDMVPMEKSEAATTTGAAPELELKAAHGLTLCMTGSVSAQTVKIGDTPLAAQSAFPSGFMVRDVKAKGAMTPVLAAAKSADGAITQEGEIAGLNLKLKVRYEAMGEGIQVSGEIEDTTGEDRAISLYYALPVAREGLTWFDDVRASRAITERKDYITSKTLAVGAVGAHSFYPVCAVANEKAGLSLSIPMDRPVLWRFAYSPTTEQLYLAYDFGLTPLTKKFPSKASFSFNIVAIDPQWGFRSALDRYYTAFPQFFEKVVKKEGIWVYADLRPIKNVEDFGVQFHEANVALKPVSTQGSGKDAFSKNFEGEEAANALEFDDKHGIYTFRYFTPMPFNLDMPMPKPQRTYELFLKGLEEAKQRKDSQGMRARAQEVAGLKDEDQRYGHTFVELGWVHGARSVQNPDPELPHTPEKPNRAYANYDPDNKEGLYVPDGEVGNSDTGLDGEYLDSLGVFTDRINFARDQFAYADFPLTFSAKSKKVCLLMEWSLAEFNKWLQADLRSKGKMIMSNFYPKTFPFSCMYIDAMGTECPWTEKDAVCNYYRAMSFQKPYLMLVNGDFTKMTPEIVQNGMKKALLYGFYPSMFNGTGVIDGKKQRLRYFEMPELYERDRELFKKYVPIVRTISTAGWQPMTGATCEDEAIMMERWGTMDKGRVYLTVYNPTKQAKQVSVKLDATLGLGDDVPQVKDIAEGHAVEVTDGPTVSFELQGLDVAVLQLEK